MRRLSRAVARVATRIVIGTIIVLAGSASRAHDGGTTGYAAISIDRQMVRYELTLSSIPASPLADQMAEQTRGQTATSVGGVSARFGLLAEAVAARVQLHNNGAPCQAGPRQMLPAKPGVVSVTARVDFVCPGDIRELAIRDNLFDVLGDDLHTLAEIDWASGSAQFAFRPDARETVITIAADDAAATGIGAISFFPLGVEHILTGYDHLLFLLALLLCGGGLLQILKIITAFTLAHSVTLALAALDIIVLPGRLVEALIALSIAYVAAENLYPRYAVSRRWVISFIFGAVHGFGFATILREAGLEKANLLWSLLNFNLGVEAGQAVVVLMVLPILMRMRASRWERKITRTVSIAVLAVGLILFVERALF